MASDEHHKGSRRRVDRERVARTLTFWLRPEFLLRVINRFQKIAGFDRSIVLASGALTAMIPLTIVASAVSTQLGGKGTADRIIGCPQAAARASWDRGRRHLDDGSHADVDSR